MKNKLVSILLVGTMCSMILISAGCDKQNQKSIQGNGKETKREEYITDDTPWYEFEEVELENVSDNSDYYYVNGELLSLIYDQSRKTHSVVRYDEEGKKKSIYDLNLGNYNDIHNHKKLPNGLAIYGISQEQSKGPDSKWFKISFDGDNMELAPMEDNCSYENANAIEISRTNGERNDNSKAGFYIGDYYIDEYEIYNSSTGSLEAYIGYVDKKDNVTTLSATDLFALNSERGKHIEYMLPLSANEVFLKIKDSMNKENEFYSLNLDTKEKKELQLSDEQEEIVKLADDSRFIENGIFIENGTIYTSDCDYAEIRKIDLAAGTKETILDLSQSFFDCTQSYRLRPLSIEDGVIKLIQSGEEGENDKICTFRKADKNPNVGKKVLSVAPLLKKWSGSGGIVDATIKKFNKSSSEYYAIQIDDYCSDKYDAISDKLLIDLMNANGPDIIVNGFEFDQLNNEDYLVDLSSFVEEYNTDECFYNIIDVSKQEGKLFQLPVEFKLEGLLIPTSVSWNDNWIDFDTYNEICEEKFGNQDALMDYGYVDRENDLDKETKKNIITKAYIKKIVANMRNPIVKDGELNIDTDEFKEVMEFLKKKLSMDFDDLAYRDKFTREEKLIRETKEARGCCLDIAKGNATLCGLPSSTKQPPAAQIGLSAAITTTCKGKDGAYDFLRILMKENKSINKDNFINGLRECLERWNGFVRNNNEGKFKDQDYIKDIDDVINKYVNSVENVTTVLRVDTTILDIICNEIQPYFTDSKSYDDTLKIVKDCCEKALKER